MGKMCSVNRVTSLSPEEEASKETKDQTTQMRLPGDTKRLPYDARDGSKKKKTDNHHPEGERDGYRKDKHPQTRHQHGKSSAEGIYSSRSTDCYGIRRRQPDKEKATNNAADKINK